MSNIPEPTLYQFKQALSKYADLTDTSWEKLKQIVHLKKMQKGDHILHEGEMPQHLYFICKGILRAYITDTKGNVYSKNIFMDKQFAASTVSLLQNSPSHFTIEVLEDATLLYIPYKEYRDMIDQYDDMQRFYISYIEQNWIISKEKYEVALVMQTAKERYLAFLHQYPDVEERVAKHYIASHLGITPTQLSRIRKELQSS